MQTLMAIAETPNIMDNENTFGPPKLGSAAIKTLTLNVEIPEMDNIYSNSPNSEFELENMIMKADRSGT